MAVNINQFAQELAKAMNEYSKEIEVGMNKATNKVSLKAVKELQSVNRPKVTGAYRSGWSRKKTDDGYVIHNKTKPGLTHLLEKGHAKRGGGRVPAIVHIRPVEDRAIETFEKEVRKVVQQ